METGSKVEAFVPLNGSAGNSAPVTGGRRHGKLKLVTRKQARKLLKKMGKKMRGGENEPAAIVSTGTTGTTEENKGGRRRTKRGSKKHGKKHSLFGLKY